MLFIPLTFVNVGKGNAVCATKVKYMTLPKTAPGFRIVKIAKKEGRFVDATNGKPTKTLIVMDDDTVIACPYTANTTLSRFKAACLAFVNNTDAVLGTDERFEIIKAHMRALEAEMEKDEDDEMEAILADYETDLDPLAGLEEADDDELEAEESGNDEEEADGEETEEAETETEEGDGE